MVTSNISYQSEAGRCIFARLKLAIIDPSNVLAPSRIHAITSTNGYLLELVRITSMGTGSKKYTVKKTAIWKIEKYKKMKYQGGNIYHHSLSKYCYKAKISILSE